MWSVTVNGDWRMTFYFEGQDAYLTVTETAHMLGVSRKALSEFVNEKASLSPEMALKNKWKRLVQIATPEL